MTSAITACKAQIDVHKYQKKGVTLEEIEQAIEYNLSQVKMNEPEYYFIPTPPLTEQNYFYNYFSEKARQRMVELFEGKWTEQEIESRVNASIESTLDALNPRNGYYREAKKIAKRDSLPLQRVWDSMIVIRRKQWGEDLLKGEVYVDYEVISIAGYLRDPRFLPYLKSMDKGNYVSEEVELALARYGEGPYLSNAVERHYKRGNFRKLAYICSNEAIEKIYEYAMTKEGLDCDSNGMDCYSLLAESAMSWLIILFNSEGMAKEMREVKYGYEYPEYIEPDKAYEKKMRSITEKYYKQFKEQEPDCENVPVNSW